MNQVDGYGQKREGIYVRTADNAEQSYAKSKHGGHIVVVIELFIANHDKQAARGCSEHYRVFVRGALVGTKKSPFYQFERVYPLLFSTVRPSTLFSGDRLGISLKRRLLIRR